MKRAIFMSFVDRAEVHLSVLTQRNGTKQSGVKFKSNPSQPRLEIAPLARVNQHPVSGDAEVPPGLMNQGESGTRTREGNWTSGAERAQTQLEELTGWGKPGLRCNARYTCYRTLGHMTPPCWGPA